MKKIKLSVYIGVKCVFKFLFWTIFKRLYENVPKETNTSEDSFKKIFQCTFKLKKPHAFIFIRKKTVEKRIFKKSM